MYRHSGNNNYNQTVFLSDIDVLLLQYAIISSLDKFCLLLACLFSSFSFFALCFASNKKNPRSIFCFSDSNIQKWENHYIYNQIYKYMKTAYFKESIYKVPYSFYENIYCTFFKETSLTDFILSNSWTQKSVSERIGCR